MPSAKRTTGNYVHFVVSIKANIMSQFTISYVMDPSSQNQGMAISSPKNPTTIVRSSSAPLGLNHQRILFKPRISMGVPSGYNHDSFKKRKTE